MPADPTVAAVNHPRPTALAVSLLTTAVLALSGGLPAIAADETAPDVEGLRAFVLQSAPAAAAVPNAPRLEVEVGSLDPRLRLAPCRRIEPYLPPGARAWGRLRLGLRCTDGDVRWNVYLPVTVRAWVRGPVLALSRPAGHSVQASDLAEGEIDLAAGDDPPQRDPAQIVGRVLARPLAAGDAVGVAALRPRMWFSAGDSVRISAVGDGYTVSGAGEALGPGIEGRPVRIRTEGGRVITAMPVADRRVELPL